MVRDFLFTKVHPSWENIMTTSPHKVFNWIRMFNFQIAFQHSSFALGFEVSPKTRLSLLTSRAWANLTEHNPLWTSQQVILSLAPNILKGNLQIVLASFFVKIWEISWISQVFNSLLMSLATLSRLFSTLIGDCIWKVVGIGIQLSLYICILWPSPILLNIHSLTRSKNSLKLHHIKKGLCPNLASITLENGKYLDLRIWQTKESGFSISLHICLANKTLLKAFKSWKPKLPRDLVLPRCFHFFQWILDFFCMWPHQNIGIKEVIALQVLLGIINKLIT